MIPQTVLTLEEESLLDEHYKKSGTALIRARAQSILLHNRRYECSEISSIVRYSTKSVRIWVNEFKERRTASLFPAYEGNSNASKLTAEQLEEIKETLSKPPSEYGLPASFWSVKDLKSYLSARYGVVYESDRSYHHLFETANYSFKLPKGFDRKRDDALIERRMLEIQEELRQLKGYEVFACDECGISWKTEIRRAWVKKGEKTTIKLDTNSKRQNYFGALNQKTGTHHLVPLLWQNSENIIEALRILSGIYKGKKLALVWDNAGWHRSKEIKALLGKGNEFGHIHLIWLPPYAPDKNPQEHIWKYGKDAIANRNYDTFAELKETFENSIQGKTFDYKM